MTIDTDNLMTIANYAKKIDRSVTNVYHLASKGEITIIKIDGVNFVLLKKEKCEK